MVGASWIPHHPLKGDRRRARDDRRPNPLILEDRSTALRGRPRGKRAAVTIASMGDDLGTAVGVTVLTHDTGRIVSSQVSVSEVPSQNLRNNPMHSTGNGANICRRGKAKSVDTQANCKSRRKFVSYVLWGWRTIRRRL